jgi:hypothetical protein
MNPIVKRDDGVSGKCCWCGKEHTSGIFVREDYSKLMCKGLHEEKKVTNDITIKTERDMATNRIRVVIGADPDNRLVDGFISEEDHHKLDFILNNSYLSYDEKIKEIKGVVDESDSYQEAKNEDDEPKKGT